MEHQADDSWSDADESLLVQCDFTEHENHQGVLAAACLHPTKNSKAIHIPFNQEVTPLHLFDKHGYLCVTDLTQQLWCEQHLCYTLMGVQPAPPSPLHGTEPAPLPTADRPEVKAGKAVHLARELEVHSVVDVKISSRADKWALHVLNLLTAINGFLSGVPLAREVPVFGDPFGTGDLIFGIVDELQFDLDSYSLRLVELKTRRAKRMPGAAQNKQHRCQVLLYKQLWDNLVKGNFSADFFLSKLELTAAADQPLSPDVSRHIDSSLASVSSSRHIDSAHHIDPSGHIDLSHRIDSSVVSASTLRQLLWQLTASAQALVCVSAVEVEYVCQETGSAIGRLSVKEEEEDSDWLWRTFRHCMDFWHGRREGGGVDIEEAWKCRTCEFGQICDWRLSKCDTLSAKNRPLVR